jgi:hypothetical protein
VCHFETFGRWAIVPVRGGLLATSRGGVLAYFSYKSADRSWAWLNNSQMAHAGCAGDYKYHNTTNLLCGRDIFVPWQVVDRAGRWTGQAGTASRLLVYARRVGAADCQHKTENKSVHYCN